MPTLDELIPDEPAQTAGKSLDDLIPDEPEAKTAGRSLDDLIPDQPAAPAAPPTPAAPTAPKTMWGRMGPTGVIAPPPKKPVEPWTGEEQRLMDELTASRRLGMGAPYGGRIYRTEPTGLQIAREEKGPLQKEALSAASFRRAEKMSRKELMRRSPTEYSRQLLAEADREPTAPKPEETLAIRGGRSFLSTALEAARGVGEAIPTAIATVGEEAGREPWHNVIDHAVEDVARQFVAGFQAHPKAMVEKDLTAALKDPDPQVRALARAKSGWKSFIDTALTSGDEILKNNPKEWVLPAIQETARDVVTAALNVVSDPTLYISAGTAMGEQALKGQAGRAAAVLGKDKAGEIARRVVDTYRESGANARDFSQVLLSSKREFSSAVADTVNPLIKELVLNKIAKEAGLPMDQVLLRPDLVERANKAAIVASSEAQKATNRFVDEIGESGQRLARSGIEVEVPFKRTPSGAPAVKEIIPAKSVPFFKRTGVIPEEAKEGVKIKTFALNRGQPEKVVAESGDLDVIMGPDGLHIVQPRTGTSPMAMAAEEGRPQAHVTLTTDAASHPVMGVPVPEKRLDPRLSNAMYEAQRNTDSYVNQALINTSEKVKSLGGDGMSVLRDLVESGRLGEAASIEDIQKLSGLPRETAATIMDILNESHEQMAAYKAAGGTAGEIRNYWHRKWLAPEEIKAGTAGARRATSRFLAEPFELERTAVTGEELKRGGYVRAPAVQEFTIRQVQGARAKANLEFQNQVIPLIGIPEEEVRTAAGLGPGEKVLRTTTTTPPAVGPVVGARAAEGGYPGAIRGTPFTGAGVGQQVGTYGETSASTMGPAVSSAVGRDIETTGLTGLKGGMRFTGAGMGRQVGMYGTTAPVRLAPIRSVDYSLTKMHPEDAETLNRMGDLLGTEPHTTRDIIQRDVVAHGGVTVVHPESGKSFVVPKELYNQYTKAIEFLQQPWKDRNEISRALDLFTSTAKVGLTTFSPKFVPNNYLGSKILNKTIFGTQDADTMAARRAIDVLNGSHQYANEVVLTRGGKPVTAGQLAEVFKGTGVPEFLQWNQSVTHELASDLVSTLEGKKWKSYVAESVAAAKRGDIKAAAGAAGEAAVRAARRVQEMNRAVEMEVRGELAARLYAQGLDLPQIAKTVLDVHTDYFKYRQALGSYAPLTGFYSWYRNTAPLALESFLLGPGKFLQLTKAINIWNDHAADPAVRHAGTGYNEDKLSIAIPTALTPGQRPQQLTFQHPWSGVAGMVPGREVLSHPGTELMRAAGQTFGTMVSPAITGGLELAFGAQPGGKDIGRDLMANPAESLFKMTPPGMINAWRMFRPRGWETRWESGLRRRMTAIGPFGMVSAEPAEAVEQERGRMKAIESAYRRAVGEEAAEESLKQR